MKQTNLEPTDLAIEAKEDSIDVLMDFPAYPTPQNTIYLVRPGGAIFEKLVERGWIRPDGEALCTFTIAKHPPKRISAGAYMVHYEYKRKPEATTPGQPKGLERIVN